MSLIVQPIRFTDNVEEMTRLLVALHSASESATGAHQGQTSLSFETDTLDELARQLTASGFGNGDHPDESMVYDEAYGRALTITVGGEALTINAAIEDPYGYSSTGVRPGPDTGDLQVTPIRFVDDQTADRRLLEALGFSVAGQADEHFTQLSLPGTGGSVDLHPAEDRTPDLPGPFAVQLHFETTTALTEIVRRAESAGVPAELHESEFGAHVTISDPDGQEIQVHAAPA